MMLPDQLFAFNEIALSNTPRLILVHDTEQGSPEASFLDSFIKETDTSTIEGIDLTDFADPESAELFVPAINHHAVETLGLLTEELQDELGLIIPVHVFKLSTGDVVALVTMMPDDSTEEDAEESTASANSEEEWD